jgi:hypothetical protein
MQKMPQVAAASAAAGRRQRPVDIGFAGAGCTHGRRTRCPGATAASPGAGAAPPAPAAPGAPGANAATEFRNRLVAELA